MDKRSYENKIITKERSESSLKADCEKCFGLCCVSLYFSVSDGFPFTKAGGKPCPNLQQNFRCKVHENLGELGLKGCLGYDCFGAGPKVSQFTFGGTDWVQMKESGVRVFECYLVMRQLHELLWYLRQAIRAMAAEPILDELASLVDETEKITRMCPEAIIELDVGAHRQKVNSLLIQTSELIREKAQLKNKTEQSHKKLIGPGKDLIGANLRNIDLRGANLRGACLIASDLRGCNLRGADLIGADLRDADIRGTDLSESIFLTQAQLNVAKGDAATKFHESMSQPSHWLLQSSK